MDRERIRQAVRAIGSYDFGESTTPLFEVDTLINASHGEPQARAWLEEELGALLTADARLAAKQEVCRRLWRIGTDASLEQLAQLLADNDPNVVAAACYAIGRRPSQRADKVLQAALGAAPAACRAAIEHLIEERG